MDNGLIKNNAVQIKSGFIPLEGIPYVKRESYYSSISNAFMFYSMFIIMFVILFYLIHDKHSYKKSFGKLNTDNMLNSLEKNIIKKVPTVVKVNKLKLYNYTSSIPVEHIILIDEYDNVIDIDVNRNYFINKQNIGKYNKGELYSIDFGNTRNIKELTILLNPNKILDPNSDLTLRPDYGVGISSTIETYNNHNKTWEHHSLLTSQENSIRIYKNVIIPINKYYAQRNRLKNTHCNTADLEDSQFIINEKNLALRLNENNEEYVYIS